MSSIASNSEDLILNADGGSSTVKFKIDGTEKASISSAGLFTSTTIDATKLTGTIPNFTSTGIDDNADANAITIDSSENVGIGTTPETGWRSSAVGVDIGTGGAIAGYDGGSGAMQVLSNAYWHTSGGSGWKYKNSSYPATMLNSDGEFVFKTAGNGTADNAITWTTQLEIKEDGRGLSQFTAKAWCKYNDTTISDSHNISSMTDVETGVSIANYSNNMASTEYAAVASTHSHYCDMHGPYIMSTNTSSLKILSLLKTNCDYGDRTTYFVVFGD